MPKYKIGTYNVNNLFDRFDDPYNWNDDTWHPRATKPKSLDEIYQLGQRLREDKPDILALQEVEGKGVLYEFNVVQLGRHFRDIALIPANDPRQIDVALVSTLPLGQVISYQFIRDTDTNRKLFSRDLLEVEILNENSQRLFTIFVTHLKSKYIDPSTPASKRDEETKDSDLKRYKQALMVARIVRARFPNPNDFYVIAGDMNDTPDSQTLAPLLRNPQLPVFDVLSAIPDPADRWTHYWSEKQQRSQLDYLLLSQGMRSRIVPGSIKVVQRGFTGGSDHRPVYVTVEF
jgi:endonuclease/exonuclease/phosphatase family metal-dependent hydrolase